MYFGAVTVPVRTNLSDTASVRLCTLHTQNPTLGNTARFAQLRGESCLENLFAQREADFLNNPLPSYGQISQNLPSERLVLAGTVNFGSFQDNKNGISYSNFTFPV